MNFILLTKSTTFIIGPIANLLGQIMNLLFEFTSLFGVTNIGLCIILFTFIIKMLMLPLTIKQQKSTKLMNIINPELQEIQKKYKGKKDQESMMKQQTETQALYDKYGVSMTAGCLPMLIQLPIMFSLYQVIVNIPAYVSSVRNYFDAIVIQLMSQPGYEGTVSEIITPSGISLGTFDFTNADKMVNLLYKFNASNWAGLAETFPSISNVITTNAEKIINMNQFLGLNLTDTPGFRLSVALIIPILAGLTQWISTKMMSTNQEIDQDSPSASSMKMMNTTMPLMSAFFCITFPIGVGIYWIATSVFQIIQQLLINAYMDKIDVNDMIAKNTEKINKKRAKKGLPPTKISKTAHVNVRNTQIDTTNKLSNKEDKEAKVKESTEYYKNSESNPNSIASKAAMVKKYNEKNNK